MVSRIPLHYRWIPDIELRRVRKIAPRLGWLSLIASIALGIVVPVAGTALTTSGGIASTVWLEMALCVAIGLFGSALTMTVLPRCVSTGYLEWKTLYGCRALMVGLCVTSLFATAVFLLFFVPGVYASERLEGFSIFVVLYMLMPVVMIVPQVVNIVIVSRVLRVSKATLRRYGPIWPRPEPENWP